MVKIKRKVEMTHEEYAKYMIDKYSVSGFESELIDDNIIDAPMEFEQTFTLNPMKKDDDPVIERSFKGVVIEVEEEITEDKWFHELVIRTVAGDYRLHKQGSINDFKHSTFNDVEAFYIPNDDLTMTLIWRDGRLVE